MCPKGSHKMFQMLMKPFYLKSCLCQSSQQWNWSKVFQIESKVVKNYFIDFWNCCELKSNQNGQKWRREFFSMKYVQMRKKFTKDTVERTLSNHLEYLLEDLEGVKKVFSVKVLKFVILIAHWCWCIIGSSRSDFLVCTIKKLQS